jgi:hypothetical protein
MELGIEEGSPKNVIRIPLAVMRNRPVEEVYEPMFNLHEVR